MQSWQSSLNQNRDNTTHFHERSDGLLHQFNVTSPAISRRRGCGDAQRKKNDMKRTAFAGLAGAVMGLFLASGISFCAGLSGLMAHPSYPHSEEVGWAGLAVGFYSLIAGSCGAVVGGCAGVSGRGVAAAGWGAALAIGAWVVLALPMEPASASEMNLADARNAWFTALMISSVTGVAAAGLAGVWVGRLLKPPGINSTLGSRNNA